MMYHIQIYGYLWSGPRACYQYSIRNEKPKDYDAIRRIAGDFASVIDYRIVRETNTYEIADRGLLRRIDTFRTLKGWSAGFTNRRYARMVNGH